MTMTEATEYPVDEEWGDESEIYRSVSTMAVFACILGIITQLAWVWPGLTVVAAVTVILGWLARRRIRRYPNELTGSRLALVGLLGGTIALVGAPTFAVVYGNLQVPEGYEMVTFGELRPSPEELGQGEKVSATAKELEGKKVFIRGYVHPAVSGFRDIRSFVLVPDIKTCCFGGQPNVYDMVEVEVVEGTGVSYGLRRRGIGGIFRVRPQRRKGPGGIDTGYFELKADHVQ